MSNRRGSVFVLSAPGGTGKTTLAKKLLQSDLPVETSISCTTREQREGEVEGQDYYFLSEKEFVEKEQRGEFIETEKLFSHRYGTLKEEVDRRQREGKDVLLVIDVKGSLSVKRKIPSAISIFLLPPSLQVLKERLIKRGGDPDVIEDKLRRSKEEMAFSKTYDYKVINDNLTRAYNELYAILKKESTK